MTDNRNGEFFEHFIEDFYAECEDHFTAARRVLLALEGVGSAASPTVAPLLQELLRTLHTLKGLSGMVGLSSAEQLAHALEDAIQVARDSGAGFSTAFVDELLADVDVLERCVSARRSGNSAPDTTATLARLSRFRSSPGHEGRSTLSDRDASPEKDPDVGLVYHFEFAPSRDLSARGIGVESMRARFRDLGELLDAKPRVTTGGIAFDFWVSVPFGRTPDEQWREEGLQWTVAPVAPRDGAVEQSPTDASPAASATGASSAAASASVVRVDLARLDGVMRMVGDLVVTRSRLDDALRRQSMGDTAAAMNVVEEANDAMERQLRRLRDGIMRIRLVHVGEVFERLRFAVRDAARESGKQVKLELHGQSTEIDKIVVDRMLEPLLHLVRNAVSHGIESAAERIAAGKPAEGTIVLSAAASGDRIVVQVEDDGAGIDMQRVTERARSQGLVAVDAIITPDDLLDLLCAPGFSTRADEVDLTSGRGVGMEIVRSAVRALAGEIAVHTTRGAGTRFVIELPLTLMIVDALLVEVGGQQMAVPQPVLREVLQVDASSIVHFENNDVVSYRGGVLPLLSLSRLFDFPSAPRAQYHVLVVGSEAAPMGLVVDRLVGLREIVFHPVVDPLVTVPGVSGATELGDGRVSLILDSPAIIRLAQAQRNGHRGRPLASRPPAVSFTST